jgi:uncharacterized protein
MLHRLAIGALAWFWTALALAQAPVPTLAGRVNDLAGALDPATRARIETRLAALEQDKGSQLAVLIVASTQPETIEQFSIRVAEAWKLGRADVDDGALLLVAKDDRSLRIEVGQGLEGAIPDAIAKRVIEEVILPRFRQGDLAGGVEQGVERLAGLVRGEPLPAPRPQEGLDGALPMFFALFMGGMVLRSMLGRLPGAGLAGGGSFLLGALVLGSVATGLVAAAIVFFLILLMDERGGGFRGGGGFGGFGGGGFGGGGFSGGGGGFSGGGASGRW